MTIIIKMTLKELRLKGQLDCLLNPVKKPKTVFKKKIGGADEAKLLETRDIMPALDDIRRGDKLSYALIAPAFLGQFSNNVTSGKLRSALKAVGFDGVIEVALFADILTLKEALEFDRDIHTERDFQLTSCCCPIWIAMIRKNYGRLLPRVPPSVSPMIAGGRVIKKLHPNALTVFIGPCVAKKAEAKEPDLIGAIDHVLTFRETRNIFDALSVNPADMPETEKDHSSHAGRIYAREGGVSRAVAMTVKRLNPERKIPVRPQTADGVAACRAMLEELEAGASAGTGRAAGSPNFFEGMGCRGGCAGGPKSIISTDECVKNIDAYAGKASFATPLDNPYTIELLYRLGFKTVESLVSDNEFFTRKL